MADFLARAEAFNTPDREIASSLCDIALAFSTQIIIGRTDVAATDPSRVRSATGSIIDIGGRPCLVTNKHVLDAYREERAKGPTVFEFAGVSIDPDDRRLYAENTQVDLAVVRLDGLQIRVDRSVVAGVPDLQVFKRTDWPAEPVSVGDKVFFAGWPEVGRRFGDDDNELIFQPYAFVGVEVRTVTDDQFTCLFDRSQFSGIFGWETARQMSERELSGLSGSPIFRDFGDGVLAPDLVGFVKQYKPEYDYLIATSANNILADGHIRPFRP